jgi:hypothetical protein
MFSLIHKDLPPPRVSAPDLHFFCLTWALDIKGLVIVLSSDCQRLLMEIPNLRISSVWSLDNHVSIVYQINVSVIW